MTGKRHEYQVVVTWTGNLGEGTARYAAYSRDHDVSGEAKPTIPGTADPAFGGDLTRWNPEELFVASLSQCHMLEFLARAARAGVVVTRYIDEPRYRARAPRGCRGHPSWSAASLACAATSRLAGSSPAIRASC